MNFIEPHVGFFQNQREAHRDGEHHDAGQHEGVGHGNPADRLSFARLMLELNDEFVRLLVVRQALAATAITLSVTSVWGMLEMFTDLPKLDVFWVFPLWCMGLAVGSIINKITLGAGGCA